MTTRAAAMKKRNDYQNNKEILDKKAYVAGL
jgi:hypothetical protein